MDHGDYQDTVDEVTEAGRDTDEREGTTDLGSRVRTPIAIVVILLVLLLTMCAAIGSITKFQITRLQFVARNAECLSCHTEVLAEMRKTSQHQPFITKHCTSCHTPHGSLVRVTERTWYATAAQRVGMWFRWGPFRWLFRDPGAKDETHTPAPSAARTTKSTTTKGGLGTSKLTSPLTTLCWSCHGNLSHDLGLPADHPPFKNGHCVSCHEPHASMTKPLLVGDDRILCGQCHPMADLNRQYLHQPAENWNCRSCHRAHGSEYPGMLIARQRTLCFGCHPTVAGDDLLRVKHPPFIGDECTSCHEPHGAPAKPMLIASQPELCYLCHPQTAAQFGRASHHPVPDKINCTSCHRAHASSYDGMLHKEQKALCLGCHDAIDHERDLVFQHQPFEKDKCTSCHVPHGSKDKPLLQAAVPTLCYRCHPGVKDQFKLPSHHPIGDKLTCTGCHRVHGSDYWGLLHSRGNKLCFRCHSSVRVTYDVSKHKDVPCLRCHTWHGSEYDPLLVKLNPPLCLDCHQPNRYYSGPRAHPTWPKFYDWHAGKGLTCTSTCHNPHGTKFDHMVRNYPSDWDGQCRQCHDDIGTYQ